MRKFLVVLALLFTLSLCLVACGESLAQVKDVQVTNTDVVSGNVTWSSVKGAYSYRVKLGGLEKYFNATSAPLSIFELVAGTEYTVTVRAESKDRQVGEESKAVKFTATEQKAVKIDAPSISFSATEGEENIVVWDAIQNASGYIVSVNGDDLEIITDTRYTITDEEALIRVKAVGDGNLYLDSEFSNTLIYPVSQATQLTAPTVTITGNVASWEPVANATSYRIKITFANGDPTPIKDIPATSPYTINLTQAGQYKVYVMAKGDGEDYLDSDYGTGAEYAVTGKQILVMGNITIEGMKLSWGAVGNASGYKVIVNSSVVEEKLEETTYTVAKAEAGDYVVLITALSNDTEKYENSQPKNVTINVSVLAAPTLALEGNKITWGDVTGAGSYELYENDELIGTVTSPYTINKSAAGTYKYKVKAIAAETSAYLSSGLSEEIIYEQTTVKTQLDTPTNVKIEGKKLSWDETAGASGYKVRIVKGQDVTEISVSGLSYDLAVDLIGTYKVSVCAISDDELKIDSDYSTAIDYVYTNQLAAPTISGEKNKVTCAPVDGATGYELYVNGESKGTVNNNVYIHIFMYAEEGHTGTFNITIKAIGDGEKSTTSEFSNTYTFVVEKLDKVSGLKIEDNKLTFNAVDGASGYLIKNGATVLGTAAGTSYTLDIRTVGEHQITVTAIGDKQLFTNGNASDAAVYSVKQLTPPQLIRSGKTLTWEAVTGATGYKLTINGEKPITIPAGTTSYEITKVVLGEYSYKLTAVGNGITLIDSDAHEITFVIAKIAAPVITKIEGTQLSWNDATNATKYKIKITTFDGVTVVNGAEVTGTSYTIAVATGKYKVYVMAVGDGFEYVDSEYSGAFDYTKTEQLAAPSITISQDTITKKLKITWSGVPNAQNYLVKNAADTDRVLYDGTNTFYEVVSLTVGDNVYSVVAVGHDEIYLSSDVATITLTKLASPSEFTFNSTSKAFEWTAIQGAKYVVSYSKDGGAEQTTTVTENTFSTASLVSGSYTFKVKSVSSTDETNVFESDYCTPITQTITNGGEQLLVPTGLIFAPTGRLVWNSVTNATSYNVHIVHDKGTKDYLVTSGNGYNFSVTWAGKYSITVKAVGDGTSYVDSEYSEAIIYTKLGMVTDITIAADKITWTKSAGATGYSLTINGEEAITLGDVSEYVVSNAVGAYTVKIIATPASTDYATASSDEAEAKQLLMSVLTVNEKEVSWVSIANASYKISYKVASGNKTELVSSQTKISYTLSSAFDAPGEYTIYVEAMLEGYTPCESQKAITIVVKVAQPSLTRDDATLKYTMTAPTGNIGGYKYKLYQGDSAPTEYTDCVDEISYPTAVGAWTLKVITKGVNGYSDSEELTLSLNVLAAPQNLKVVEQTFSFGTVTDATKYSISGTFDDTAYSNEITALSVDWTGGVYKVKVRAIGDGNNLPSPESTEFKALLISTLDHFKKLILPNTSVDNEHLGMTISLINDITLDNTFTTLTTNSEKKFWGLFEGNNKTIGPVKSEYGLFGYNCGTIQNLKVVADINASSASDVGAIAKGNYRYDDGHPGLIKNVEVTGTVVGGEYNVGGLVGILSGGTMQYCINKATVTGGSNVGGIAGTSEEQIVATSVDPSGFLKATITQCGNEGTINGVGSTGGIAGHSRSKISECYNRGSVGTAVTTIAGGIVGHNSNFDNKDERKGAVWNCYNTGVVTGKTEGEIKAGGIVGLNKNSDSMPGWLATSYNVGICNKGAIFGWGVVGGQSNCFFLAGTGYAGDEGGATEKNADFFKATDFTNHELFKPDADGNTVWAVAVSNVNGGYVTLAWEKVSSL